MDWQGDDYSFLCIDECWGRLGVKEPKDFHAWRENYPVTVAVLDSGITRDHVAFRHLPEIRGKNFTPDGTALDIDDDDDGHGTQCAAIIAGGTYDAADGGEKEAGFCNGVAPFADLYICKIDRSDVRSVIAAINELIDKKKDGSLKVDVICIPLGFTNFDAQLRKCIYRASLKNITVVCAACSDGRKRSLGVQYPARFGDVICVGSHDMRGRPSKFTPVGREIDILGPGEVRSATPGKDGVKNAISAVKGTSFAAPFVAGIVAMVLANAQRVGGESLRTAVSNNAVMRHILREMATEPGEHSEDHGHGILDPSQIFPDELFHQTVQEITTEYHPLTKDSGDEQQDNEGRLDISELTEAEDAAAKLLTKMQKIGESTFKPDTKVTIAVIGGKLANPEQLNIVAKQSYLPEDEQCSTRVLDFAPGHTQYVVAEVANSKQSKANIANDINEAVNVHNADVVLIQVGFEKFNLNTLRAVSKAMQKGRVVIAAAPELPETSREIPFPAKLGDVICVGSHSKKEEGSAFNTRGRELDFLALGEGVSGCCGTAVAAMVAAATVGFTLLYAESVGGIEMRKGVQCNAVMREFLRGACSRRGRHTPDQGHGILNPHKLFRRGPEHFKHSVRQIVQVKVNK
ncbi:MBTPS1 [Branchiostoma lanceolatum]|uniref:MBTPS1 protein n=1 Tax=Branchiostoma lanceolatum TaxID=7740 RepID=A0A8K0E9V1_BRALA|nr:MBTPS1 [Branchiostoma lanceolatum]